MPFAKGVTSGYLPLGGVMVSDRVADVLIDKAGEFFHGYTYSGHPAACAAGIATMDIYEKEDLFQRAAELAPSGLPAFAPAPRGCGHHGADRNG